MRRVMHHLPHEAKIEEAPILDQDARHLFPSDVVNACIAMIEMSTPVTL